MTSRATLSRSATIAVREALRILGLLWINPSK